MFQSTRPCGARLYLFRLSMFTPEFQSTRPCGARPTAEAAPVCAAIVSIHAPLRGATIPSHVLHPGPEVSIHAPLRGATGCVAILFLCIPGFNPRALAGRDSSAMLHWTGGTWFQSTRPCGARPQHKQLFPYFLSFNPRALAGRDDITASRSVIGSLFQSTRPCGARRATGWFATRFELEFQSTRPCGARRSNCCRYVRALKVSIHAPLRGATLQRLPTSRNRGCFNPRALAGRDAAAS